MLYAQLVRYFLHDPGKSTRVNDKIRVLANRFSRHREISRKRNSVVLPAELIKYDESYDVSTNSSTLPRKFAWKCAKGGRRRAAKFISISDTRPQLRREILHRRFPPVFNHRRVFFTDTGYRSWYFGEETKSRDVSRMDAHRLLPIGCSRTSPGPASLKASR